MKPVKNFVKSLKKDLRSRSALTNALRFVAVFVISFLTFTYVLIPLTSGFWDGMGPTHARASAGMLSWFGVEAGVEGNVLTVDVQGEDVSFIISRLCSGDIEIALLFSLLIASFDVLLIWRIVGTLLGASLLFFMNPMRIALTLLITKDSGMEAGDFYHTLIFRLFLFVLLVLYYFAWYKAFAGRKSWFQERICQRLRC